MQADLSTQLEQKELQFQRNFARMNTIWILISALTLGSTSYAVLSSRAGFLSDWHLFAIIGLSLAIILLFLLAVRIQPHIWPRPFRLIIPAWGSIYLCVLLLILLDTRFIYDLYVVFGMAFAMFSGYALAFVAGIVFVTIGVYGGLFTWPMSSNNILAVIGTGVGVFSMTAVGMMSQYLTYERYERNTLLEQLTQAHTELAEAHQQLAHSAAQEQELAVLRERTRLAREMHDTLGHALVLVSVKLEAVQRLRERDAERCEQELLSTKEIVRESMKELRASIANLRSPALEHEPACRALSRYAREMAIRAGFHVTYDLHEDIEGLPEQIEETVWKVGQEALTNVEKHAHANNVILHMSRCASHVVLRIADDGIGLSTDCAAQRVESTTAGMYISSPGHYGVSGMIERVEQVGGRIAFRSAQEHGTIVEIELPLVETPM